MSYWSWTRRRLLVLLEDLALAGGMTTSFLEIVMPASVAY